ncbi:unnamed protein product [Nippostrongylus brasiliensis]|uniref:Uncharacterized protein n=1 Tax=Nippostrongylus brasiliensis TaxID=27835 RepID=A0A0N4XRX4_NIPBR|nr:unnamed protein product [Nippostrongylus brasiliensis]
MSSSTAQRTSSRRPNCRRENSFSKRRSSDILPSILRQISRRSPRIFRKHTFDRTTETETMILANPLVDCSSGESRVKNEAHFSAHTESEPLTPPPMGDRPLCSRSTTANSGDFLESPGDAQPPANSTGTPTDSQVCVVSFSKNLCLFKSLNSFYSQPSLLRSSGIGEVFLEQPFSGLRTTK